jgi:hypothetical protein
MFDSVAKHFLEEFQGSKMCVHDPKEGPVRLRWVGAFQLEIVKSVDRSLTDSLLPAASSILGRGRDLIDPVRKKVLARIRHTPAKVHALA